MPIKDINNRRPLRWTRSRKNRIIAGVCSGVAHALDLAPWTVRLLWLLVAFATYGIGIIAYILCVIAFPRDDLQIEGRQKMILGVCARIDQRGDMEVGLARLIALILLIVTGGIAIVGYILLHFILAEPPQNNGRII